MSNLSGMAIGNGCISDLTSWQVCTRYNSTVTLTDFGLSRKVEFLSISCFNHFFGSVKCSVICMLKLMWCVRKCTYTILLSVRCYFLNLTKTWTILGNLCKIADLQEVGGSCGDWMELAQDRDRWQALVSTVRNLWVPKMQWISWLAAEPVSFSRRTLLHGISK